MHIARLPISSSPLGLWIAEHMPELGTELGPMRLDDCRMRLNEITGLNVPSHAPIRESTDLFLAALKSAHGEPANGA